MRYYSPKRGEWVQPIKRGYKMRCCDCGLVHTMNFRVVVQVVRNANWFVLKSGQIRHKVQFQAARNNLATAAVRRNFEAIRVIKGKGAKP